MRAAAVAGLAERAARRYRDPKVATLGLSEEPRSSLAYGAAGVAYFLLRHASLGGGERSLEGARMWAAQAERACEAGAIRGGSLLYGEPGVWWLQALVADAALDVAEVRRSADRFTAAATLAVGAAADVASGSAGLLLGCAQLLESVDDAVAVAPVGAVAARIAFDLLALVERDGGKPGETSLGYLGAAHGWAGVAQALLRWSRATHQQPSVEVLALLERLIALRRPSGRWPVQAGSDAVRLGWCHGSAGWAQLWTLAWQLIGEQRLLDLAEFSAQDAVDADEDNPSLCCGRAGQGYAALTLYQATGQRRWLDAAHKVAAEATRTPDPDKRPAHRLFSGELGVALLAAELEEPTRASMPVYQSIS